MSFRYGPRLVCSMLFSFTILISSLLIPFGSTKAADALPDTGQTKCFNAIGEIPCPASGAAFYGQDGNYEGLPPAYQVSANGLLVTDLNTGLMWQQAEGATMTWESAIAHCENLALSGYDDWHLPSRLELISILDYGRTSPAINPAFACRSQNYWSGSVYDVDEDKAWHVNFGSGVTGNLGKTLQHYVRCVRGGP